tara:strand:+ start:159 stop:446 length:288 start_codon:yes stop_codon:yes gene_type:complete
VPFYLKNFSRGVSYSYKYLKISNKGEVMANKDSFARKHRYLDNQITRLEKTNHYNREQITTLKKRKLKLKDKQVSLEREAVKHAKEIQLALGIGS